MESLDDNVLVKYENRLLKEGNLRENLRREQKKQRLRKLQILEKDYAESQKRRLERVEKAMLDKAKQQAQTVALKTKEEKKAVMERFKAYSIIDKR